MNLQTEYKELSAFQEMACIAGLKTLLDPKKHFNIVDFKKLAEILEIEVKNDKDFQSLELLHCVSYKDMPEALVRQTRDVVFRLLKINDNVIDVIVDTGKDPVNTEYTESKRGFLRLFK